MPLNSGGPRRGGQGGGSGALVAAGVAALAAVAVGAFLLGRGSTPSRGARGAAPRGAGKEAPRGAPAAEAGDSAAPAPADAAAARAARAAAAGSVDDSAPARPAEPGGPVEPPEPAPAARVTSLLRNGSFEGSTRYWPECGDVVTDSPSPAPSAGPTSGAVAPGHGRYCVRLREKGSLRSGSFRIEPGSRVTVSLMARAERGGRVSMTLCPSNRGVAQGTGTVWCRDPKFGGSAEIGPGWTRRSWTFDIPELAGDGSFLGSSDGWWNRTSWILWIGGEPRPLWVDGVSVVAGDDPGRYVPHSPVEIAAVAPAVSRERYPKDANLLEQDEEVEVRACASNPGDAPAAVTLRWEVLDYEGGLRFGRPKEREVRIPAGGTVVEAERLKLAGRGLMLARVSVLDAQGRLVSKSDQPLTALAFPKAATRPNTDERVGGSLRGGPLVVAAQRIGLGWTRWFPHFNWNAIQKERPDRWNWPDDIVRDCHAHGISVTAVLHHVPEWAKGTGDKLCREMEAWAKDDPRWKDLSVETPWDRFVKALVEHYGHEGIVYEIANEPDIGKWDAAGYANLARRTYRLVKQTDAKAIVQANVTWPGVSGWTQEFVRRGGLEAFDCHTFHNYTTWHLAGPGAIAELRTFFKSFGAPDKRVWFNEGWTYYPTSEDFPAPPIVDVSPPAAAHMVAQTAAQLFAEGMEKLITFHIGYAQHGKSWWDWVGSGTEWWDDVGNPTVAVAVYNVIADQLGLSDPVGTVRPEGAVLHVFEDRRHGRGVAVAWATGGRDVELELPLSGLVKIDCVGNASPVEAAGGSSRLSLRADGKPFYLHSTAGVSGADLLAKLEPLNARAGGEGVYVLPDEWTGAEVGAADGNPFVRDGKELWRLDQVWPDDAARRGNYVPLTWNGKEWAAKEHSHGGQPAASVRQGVARLSARAPWNGQPGKKLASLSFVAPERGTYEIRGTLHIDRWEGGEELTLRVRKLDAAGACAELASVRGASERRSEAALPTARAELAPGDRLVLVPDFRGWHSAGTFTLKDFSVRRAR